VTVTTQLPERLRSLADEAPPTLHAQGLWQAGRRRHRRRLVTAVAVTGCLVAAVAALGVGDWQSRQPEPSAPTPTVNGPMSVPDRLYNPSPWTSGTSTPGRLVAFMTSTRDHFPFGSDKNALVGVSAGSQSYHFLEGLAGWSDSATDVSLSPDGLHLAYWVTGTTTGTPSAGAGSVTGMAVLDLRTGTVRRYDVPTAHGLVPQSLGWTDNRTVAMTADHFTSARVNSWAGQVEVRLFTLGRSTPVVLPHSNVNQVPVTSVGGYAGMVSSHVLRSYDSSGQQRADLRTSVRLKSVAYDAPLGLVAGTQGNVNASGSTSGRLVVGHAVRGHVHLVTVPRGRGYYQALAWVDPTHIATLRLTRTGEVYDVVDTRTGDRQPLTRKPWYGFGVAADALRNATTVPGVAPPRPWNPRWVAVGLLGVLVAVVAALGVVLRRIRARR
jgi:hypothetical protein